MFFLSAYSSPAGSGTRVHRLASMWLGSRRQHLPASKSSTLAAYLQEEARGESVNRRGVGLVV